MRPTRSPLPACGCASSWPMPRWPPGSPRSLIMAVKGSRGWNMLLSLRWSTRARGWSHLRVRLLLVVRCGAPPVRPRSSHACRFPCTRYTHDSMTAIRDPRVPACCMHAVRQQPLQQAAASSKRMMSKRERSIAASRAPAGQVSKCQSWRRQSLGILWHHCIFVAQHCSRLEQQCMPLLAR